LKRGFHLLIILIIIVVGLSASYLVKKYLPDLFKPNRSVFSINFSEKNELSGVYIKIGDIEIQTDENGIAVVKLKNKKLNDKVNVKFYKEKYYPIGKEIVLSKKEINYGFAMKRRQDYVNVTVNVEADREIRDINIGVGNSNFRTNNKGKISFSLRKEEGARVRLEYSLVGEANKRYEITSKRDYSFIVSKNNTSINPPTIQIREKADEPDDEEERIVAESEEKEIDIIINALIENESAEGATIFVNGSQYSTKTDEKGNLRIENFETRVGERIEITGNFPNSRLHNSGNIIVKKDQREYSVELKFKYDKYVEFIVRSTDGQVLDEVSVTDETNEEESVTKEGECMFEFYDFGQTYNYLFRKRGFEGRRMTMVFNQDDINESRTVIKEVTLNPLRITIFVRDSITREVLPDIDVYAVEGVLNSNWEPANEREKIDVSREDGSVLVNFENLDSNVILEFEKTTGEYPRIRKSFYIDEINTNYDVFLPPRRGRIELTFLWEDNENPIQKRVFEMNSPFATNIRTDINGRIVFEDFRLTRNSQVSGNLFLPNATFPVDFNMANNYEYANTYRISRESSVHLEIERDSSQVLNNISILKEGELIEEYESEPIDCNLPFGLYFVRISYNEGERSRSREFRLNVDGFEIREVFDISDPYNKLLKAYENQSYDQAEAIFYQIPTSGYDRLEDCTKLMLRILYELVEENTERWWKFIEHIFGENYIRIREIHRNSVNLVKFAKVANDTEEYDRAMEFCRDAERRINLIRSNLRGRIRIEIYYLKGFILYKEYFNRIQNQNLPRDERINRINRVIEQWERSREMIRRLNSTIYLDNIEEFIDKAIFERNILLNQ